MSNVKIYLIYSKLTYLYKSMFNFAYLITLRIDYTITALISNQIIAAFIFVFKHVPNWKLITDR